MKSNPLAHTPALAALVLSLFILPAHADSSAASAASLKEKHGQIRERLDKSPFGRPLHLDSKDSNGDLKGDVYAVLKHPFEKVNGSLSGAKNWCDILTLPFNVQKCDADGDSLSVFIGRKPDSPIGEATRLDFKFSVPAKGGDLLQVQLAAPTGPAGTKNYRIVFAATPVDAGRTFVHMSYGYSHGTMSKIAMQTYLSTSGADKVGFTTDGKDAEGKAKLVGGTRGVMERNTMRYFLAIESYLDSLEASGDGRRRASLDKWFNATERYPRQLREMSREEYLALKQRAPGKAKVATN